MMLFVVPHVQLTVNYHILLWAPHRVTTELRACRHRNSPRVYASERKNGKPSAKRGRQYGTDVKRTEKKKKRTTQGSEGTR